MEEIKKPKIDKKECLNIIEAPSGFLSSSNSRISTLVFRVLNESGKQRGLVTGQEIKRLLEEYKFKLEDFSSL